MKLIVNLVAVLIAFVVFTTASPAPERRLPFYKDCLCPDETGAILATLMKILLINQTPYIQYTQA
jgi:hypothetical protein